MGLLRWHSLLLLVAACLACSGEASWLRRRRLGENEQTPARNSLLKDHTDEIDERKCQAASLTLNQLCCSRRPPDGAPSGERAFSFFLVASNDRYGSYRAAMRSSAALYALVHGLYTFNLHHDIEIIVVDWQAEQGSGRIDDRSCQRGLVRIIEVQPEVANGYAPDSVSEVHSFNIAVRRMRGRNILRIDQDTLTQGPFFSWLAWQKRHGWPDSNHVIWAGRDSGIRMDQVPFIVDDIKVYTSHVDHSCHAEGKTVPKRGPIVKGEGIWGTGCSNGAVGVYGYPKELMEDVRGMNERMVYWGHMEAELCSRARESPKLTTMVDIGRELCGASFAHMEHLYGRKDQGAAGDTTFRNTESWGLWNETLPEYVY